MFCLQLSIFFLFPLFLFKDKHCVSIQHSLLWSGLRAARSNGAPWRCSGSLPSEGQGTHGDSMFPADCTGSLKTCLCQVSESRQGWSCCCSPFPFKAAGRSGFKVQAHVRVCSRRCLQFAPAYPEPLTCHLTSAPRSPENEGEPGLCPSPSPMLERAALPVLEQVPVTRQDLVPFSGKPSHAHSTAG